MLLDMPFRGADAVAAGFVTPAQLRGPRFRRLFRGIHVSAEVEPTLAVRSRAAALVVPGGVLGGWSAAELLDASCGPADAPVELVVPGGGPRSRAGLVVRADDLDPTEIVRACGVAVTTPVRTAFDLGRRRPLREAVVAIDALARVGEFAPGVIEQLARCRPGARGVALLREAVRRADRRSGSPMETRIRLAIEDGGLPLPVLQHPVGRYLLDLAYPEVRLAVEYDGRDHLTPQRAQHDLERQAWLSTRGWTVLRFRAFVVMRQPHRIAATVARELAR